MSTTMMPKPRLDKQQIAVANIKLLLVSKLLGHASVETTQVYVAMPDERLRAGMAAVLLSA